nr:S8 family peptidase [Fimbriiglobus ruber]
MCVLDGGVVLNPLLASALDSADCHRYDPNWPLADAPDLPAARKHSHGSEMAGVVLYGRHLADLLAGTELHALTHRLESVRILPPKPYENERRLYGAITSQAISRVEIAAPDRVRSFCMAVTTDGRDRGRPSSWSGVVDQICGGFADQNPRLFFLSAGNTDPNERHRYPESNDTDPVQDPGQAWNAITVGACTDRVTYDHDRFPGYAPIAPAGDLSPSSTTSLTWDKPWPYKPDFVLEGGNQIAHTDKRWVMDPDDMTMLTTAHATTGRVLADFRDTSAATAQAAGIAAALQAVYPKLWPETIRGLLVHSAEWTDRMRAAFGDKKTDHINRLRRYGYGVPSLARARDSARDSLTMVIEQAIQPFTKEGSDIKTKEMGLHNLPWPKDQLLELGETKVTMRVTLSYFIEPKPGRREGFVKHRHRYQSHGLRFEVKRPQETLDDFRKRVSQAARHEEEEFEAVGDTSGWELGPQLRTRGSIHCDWWTGTAADLANSGVIAVYPVSGWWRESKGNDWSKEARYALLVSIRAEPVRVAVSLFTPTEIDLYSPIQTTILAAIEQEVTTEVGGESATG